MTDRLKLWTIQREEAWETAQQRGVLRADGRRSISYYRPAYRWLRTHMRRRIEGATGCYPVWAWQQPKPDLRHDAHLPRGTRGFRIEIVVPAASVLLSDFGASHSILNGSFLPLSREEDDVFDARAEEHGYEWLDAQQCLDIAYAAGEGDPVERVRISRGDIQASIWQEIHASWDRVFDLEALAKSSYWNRDGPDSQYIQATIEQISLDQVVSVQPFIAR